MDSCCPKQLHSLKGPIISLALSNAFVSLMCWERKYAPKCNACKQLIIPKEDGTDSYNVECLGHSYHEDCYRCEVGIQWENMLMACWHTDTYCKPVMSSAGLRYPALSRTKWARQLSFGREDALQVLPPERDFWSALTLWLYSPGVRLPRERRCVYI